jgi:hypothetical protein
VEGVTQFLSRCAAGFVPHAAAFNNEFSQQVLLSRMLDAIESLDLASLSASARKAASAGASKISL